MATTASPPGLFGGWLGSSHASPQSSVVPRVSGDRSQPATNGRTGADIDDDDAEGADLFGDIRAGHAIPPSRDPNTAVYMRGVSKTYLLGVEGVPALRGVTMTIRKGEFVVICGKSGGGKTSMLNIIGTIDKPTRGDLYLGGVRVDAKTTDAALADIRLRQLGFVFQGFNLLPSLTALENVELPMVLAGWGNGSSRRKRAIRLLTRVGLSERLHHVPSMMSGGEQQRTTIARALANRPHILLLDEPTGDLDGNNSHIVLKILTDLNRKEGVTCVMVTHDVALKAYAHRVLHMVDGKIARVEDIPLFVRDNALETLSLQPAVIGMEQVEARRKADARAERGYHDASGGNTHGGALFSGRSSEGGETGYSGGGFYSDDEDGDGSDVPVPPASGGSNSRRGATATERPTVSADGDRGVATGTWRAIQSWIADAVSGSGRGRERPLAVGSLDSTRSHVAVGVQPEDAESGGRSGVGARRGFSPNPSPTATAGVGARAVHLTSVHTGSDGRSAPPLPLPGSTTDRDTRSAFTGQSDAGGGGAAAGVGALSAVDNEAGALSTRPISTREVSAIANPLVHLASPPHRDGGAIGTTADMAGKSGGQRYITSGLSGVAAISHAIFAQQAGIGGLTPHASLASQSRTVVRTPASYATFTYAEKTKAESAKEEEERQRALAIKQEAMRASALAHHEQRLRQLQPWLRVGQTAPTGAVSASTGSAAASQAGTGTSDEPADGRPVYV